jgi:hypothetical protein
MTFGVEVVAFDLFEGPIFAGSLHGGKFVSRQIKSRIHSRPVYQPVFHRCASGVHPVCTPDTKSHQNPSKPRLLRKNDKDQRASYGNC